MRREWKRRTPLSLSIVNGLFTINRRDSKVYGNFAVGTIRQVNLPIERLEKTAGRARWDIILLLNTATVGRRGPEGVRKIGCSGDRRAQAGAGGAIDLTHLARQTSAMPQLEKRDPAALRPSVDDPASWYRDTAIARPSGRRRPTLKGRRALSAPGASPRRRAVEEPSADASSRAARRCVGEAKSPPISNLA